jgi:membrane protein DedA with SNARE-associated domain
LEVTQFARWVNEVLMFFFSTDTLLANIAIYGPWILGLSTLISASGTPFPITPLMIAAGAFIQQDGFEQAPLLLWGLLGVVIGDSIAYLVGRYALGAIRRLSPRRMEALWAKAEFWFNRYGGSSVFLSRWLLNSVDVPISFISGGAGLSFWTYLKNISFGRLLWVLLYGGLGFVVGAQWQAFNENMKVFQTWLLILILLGCVFYFLRSRWQEKVFSPSADI